MANHIKNRRKDFKPGYTPIVKIGKDYPEVRLGARVLKSNESVRGYFDSEACLLLLKGKVEIEINRGRYYGERESLFEENPSVLLVSSSKFLITAYENGAELIEIQTLNSNSFEPLFISPSDVRVEKRGQGMMEEAAYRLVKAVFDKTNAPQSNLVVGEVVNFAGRWSSYPPHHHPQPEIYFYRFLPEIGYGFCQLGDRVLKVQNNDAVRILNGVDHPQVAAPGYTMWYLWVVRHLPSNPYTGFEFDPKHIWMLKS